MKFNFTEDIRHTLYKEMYQVLNRVHMGTATHFDYVIANLVKEGGYKLKYSNAKTTWEYSTRSALMEYLTRYSYLFPENMKNGKFRVFNWSLTRYKAGEDNILADPTIIQPELDDLELLRDFIAQLPDWKELGIKQTGKKAHDESNVYNYAPCLMLFSLLTNKFPTLEQLSLIHI